MKHSINTIDDDNWNPKNHYNIFLASCKKAECYIAEVHEAKTATNMRSREVFH